MYMYTPYLTSLRLVNSYVLCRHKMTNNNLKWVKLGNSLYDFSVVLNSVSSVLNTVVLK